MNADMTYTKTVSCPYCNSHFEILRIKARFFRVKERYLDFGAIYENDLSPYFYEIIVCPFCGYSWDPDNEAPLMPVHRERLKPILSNWHAEDLNNSLRTPQEAILVSMRGILCNQVSKGKQSTLARKCLHLAWIYRGLGDKENEQRFLKAARDSYREALQTEDLWSEHNGSEILATYMAAVLSHLIGDEATCKRWLSQVIFNHPEHDQRPNIVNMARDLWSDIRHADWRSTIAEIEVLAKEKDAPSSEESG